MVTIIAENCLVTFRSEDGTKGFAMADGLKFDFKASADQAKKILSVTRAKGTFKFDVRAVGNGGNIIVDIIDISNVINLPKKVS